MNRNDRIALTLVVVLLVFPSLFALVLALSSPVKPVSGSGPIILAPRSGDEVGPNFDVAGCGGSMSGTTATVSGEFTGSGTCSSSPDWTVGFSAGSARGAHNASATGGLSGVDFTIVGSQSLVLALPTVSAVLGGGFDVTILGTHNQPMSPPPVTVRLYRSNNTLYSTMTATDLGGGSWRAVFPSVPSNSYSAQASMTVMGKTNTCSQAVHVP